MTPYGKINVLGMLLLPLAAWWWRRTKATCFRTRDSPWNRVRRSARKWRSWKTRMSATAATPRAAPTASAPSPPSAPQRAAHVGFYSYGEISPAVAGGASELHNQTMTVTVLSEA